MSSSNDIPLISVITVCYNAEEFIEQTIRSVLDQNYNNYEYLIIDGGSTDRTKEIIVKYKDRLTYWQSEKDRGLAHGFNIGVRRSTGKWIAFLNSDDYYANNQVLSIMAKHLTKYSDADVVHGQITQIRRQQSEEIVLAKIGGPWFWESFRCYSSILHPAAFTQRVYIEGSGLFNEQFRNAVDYEMYLRKGKALRTVFVPFVMTYMRIGGMSKNSGLRSLIESWKAQTQNKAQTKWSASILLVYYGMRQIVSSLVGRIFPSSSRRKNEWR